MTRQDAIAVRAARHARLGNVLGDAKRVLTYALVRLLALFVTVVIGVYLAIVVANMGGKVDELRISQIQSTIGERHRAAAEDFGGGMEELQALIDADVGLEIRRLRLDEPFLRRSVDYLVQAITLDLGRAEQLHSDSGSRRVRDIILERLPATLILFGTAYLLLFVTSIVAALHLSRRYGSGLDRMVVALAPTSAAPSWFFGIFLILIFGFGLGILPAGGMVAIPPPEGKLAYGLSLARHLVLPVSAIFLSSVFVSIYSWRTFFLIHSSEDYVEMARAKGLPGGLIERRYILRPALPPIVTNFALSLIGLWTGSIITERIFNWPGLGSLLFQAIGQVDTPVIIGSVVIFAYLLAATVFLLDIVYAIVDPRVRLQGGTS